MSASKKATAAVRQARARERKLHAECDSRAVVTCHRIQLYGWDSKAARVAHEAWQQSWALWRVSRDKLHAAEARGRK